MWHKPNGAMSESYDDLIPEQEYEFSLGFVEGLPIELLDASKHRPSEFLRPIPQLYRNRAYKASQRKLKAKRFLAHMRILGF